MAYTKTNWVNNAAPPISAENLNKIEQELYTLDVDVTEITARMTAAENTLASKADSADIEFLSENKAPMIESTVSGAIVSFDDGANLPVSEMLVGINAEQDLHGQANPYPAGGGKNLLQLTTNGTYTIGSTGASAKIEDGKITVTGTTTVSGGRTTRLSQYFTLKAGTYIISPLQNDSPYIRSYLNRKSDDGALGYSNGNAITLAEDTEVYFGIGVESGKTYNVSFYPQVEAGSTITAYAPYSNICPIRGWDSVDVNVVGKNLLDSSNAVPNLPRNVVGAGIDEVIVTTRYAHSIPYKNDVAFMVSARSDDLTKFNYIVVYGYNNDKFVSSYGGRNIANTTTVYTIPIPANQYEKIIVVYGADSTTQVGTDISGDIQLELGTTATSYEPYNGNTTTIDLGQTVYGGTLDVTTGVLTKTYGVATFDDTNDWKNLSGRTFYLDTGITNAYQDTLQDQDGLSNLYEWTEAGSTPQLGIRWQVSQTNPGRLFVYDYVYDSDLVGFKAMLQSSPLQIVYKLATPQTYQLTPVEVQTLLGANNIWADCGDIENVTYKADTKLYVDNTIVDVPLAMIAPMETGTTSSKAYAVGEYFILNGNQFCKAKTAIASGATFTLNTNYTVTTIGAELKALQ